MSATTAWMDAIEEDEIRESADRFSVRLAVPTGILSADQLGTLSNVARQHGAGFVQLAARQAVEIPGVGLAELGTVQTILSAAGLTTGTPGARVRNVVACTGVEKCGQAFLDPRVLGRALDLLFGGDDFPAQIRIAVAGCPASCTAPQMADIGFVGMVEPVLDRATCDGCGLCADACDERSLVMRRGLPRRDPQRCAYCGACVAACPAKSLRAGRLGYTVYVGGRAGRRPVAGSVLARFVAEEEAPDVAARVIAYLRQNGQPRERLYSLIHRTGIEPLRAYVHSRPLHRAPLRDA